MPMMRDDFGRRFILDVCAAGSVTIRERGAQIADGLLPVFSVDTHDEAEAIRVRHCRRANDGSGLYFLNDPPKDVDDLGRIADLFRAMFDTLRKKPASTEPSAEPPADDVVLATRIVRVPGGRTYTNLLIVRTENGRVWTYEIAAERSGKTEAWRWRTGYGYPRPIGHHRKAILAVADRAPYLRHGVRHGKPLERR